MAFRLSAMPVRSSLKLDGTVLLIMPCYDSRCQAAGVKLVSVGGQACRRCTSLLDPETRQRLARMEANYLTDLRTAATSAVATDLLARKDAETLGIFGSGRQAAIAFCRSSPRAQVQALSGLRIGHDLTCSDFCAKMKAELGLQVEP